MLLPQECFDKFNNKQYRINNIAFLNPVYQEIFKDMGFEFRYSEEYKNAINKIKNYIVYLYDLKKKDELSIDNIDEKILNIAIENIKLVLKEIKEKRNNVNGIESFCWLLLNISGLNQIDSLLKDEELLLTQLKSLQLFEIIKNIDYHFFAIMLSNLESKYILKSPTRRKGMFDKIVFDLLSKKLLLQKEISNSGDWLIDEKEVKKIDGILNILGVTELKYPDVICKIKNTLIIGAHKEQNMAGGGQDNQAIDAKRIFMLKETADENLLKKKFNIEKILYVIIYDTYSEIRTGRHWEAIYSDVKEPNNTSKYVVNSVIFKELIENIK